MTKAKKSITTATELSDQDLDQAQGGAARSSTSAARSTKPATSVQAGSGAEPVQQNPNIRFPIEDDVP